MCVFFSSATDHNQPSLCSPAHHWSSLLTTKLELTSWAWLLLRIHLLFIRMAIVRLHIPDCNGEYNGPSHYDKCWFSVPINHIQLHVYVSWGRTDWQREMDGFRWRRRRGINAHWVQVESRYAISAQEELYAEHSVFELVRGHSWRACSCVVRQRGGRLVIPLKPLRSRCAVTVFAWGHPCQYLQAFAHVLICTRESLKHVGVIYTL